jgi:hypothetical protein
MDHQDKENKSSNCSSSVHPPSKRRHGSIFQ